ncbi:MAG: signal peptidase I [Candidatus Omnitrophica bacterium]|nr:signal peptidase I [Candidatus Omnitrophota bacterium]
MKKWLQNPKTRAEIRDTVESLFVALVLALVIRTFVVQAFKIPTGSMIPTLQIGDRIMVNKFIYWFRDPAPGDVVVFKFPEDPKMAFIKRCIAGENSEVEIRNGKIILNGAPLDEPRLSGWYYYNVNESLFGAVGAMVSVPPHALYVLGDNSRNSKDSRYWGFVPRHYVLGKAFLIYWPLHRIRLMQ